MTRRWETTVLSLCFALSGLIALALVYGGTATYESLMRDQPVGVDRGGQPARGGPLSPLSPQRTELRRLTQLHNAWFAYVTGDAPEPPASSEGMSFTRDEYAHMADVRNVFIGARVVAIGAAVLAALVIVRVGRRDRRTALVLVRDAAIAASVGSAVVAIAAAVAFDPLFLLFHEIFFPQGNFLFPPDSNLLAMYPDPYWYGMTLRIGLTFVVAMAVIAVVTTATLRQTRR